MSKLFNWAAARLVAAFALALPLAAMADFEKTNPVTGETENYSWKFVGTDTWDDTSYWQDSASANPSGVPAKSGGNVWDPVLFDGDTVDIDSNMSVEGWNLRMGLYNGASVKMNTVVKYQGDTTMWITVDETSQLTFGGCSGGNITANQAIKLSVAKANGIAWNADLSSGNANNTFEYYLKGAGSVSYQAVSAANHKIKMADVALTGTSQVSHKTLVSFTSAPTFTADASIKVLNGSTVVATKALTAVNTTATLTTDNAVGTCELVQTSTGIDLYWVDGDPANLPAATVYKPSININFTSGTALSTVADVGISEYAIPGTSWNNLIGNNGSLTTVTGVSSNGAASAISGAKVTIAGTRGYYYNGNVQAASDLRQGYIDDNNDNPSPQFVVEGIPYYRYKTVLYFSSDGNATKFGYVTVNGLNYKGDLDNKATVASEGGSEIWGSANTSAFTEGGNYLVIPTQTNTDGKLTVVSHRLSGSRAGLAAVQIVEVKPEVTENDLVISVSGDTTYTVEDAQNLSGTVYITGNGTLTLAGEAKISAATINVGPLVTLVVNADRLDGTTFTGGGTVVYDGSQPDTTKGFNNSAWAGTVWVKNVGDTSRGEATDSKVTTCLGSNTADASSNDLNKWGNANSFVKFTNVRAYMAAANVPWTLILEDDSTNYAWYNNEGWTARTITIAGLKGNGTFWDINDGGCRPFLNFTDASQFSGSIKALGKQVFLNGAGTGNASDLLSGRIVVPADQVLTVSAGETWHTRNGLVVNGTLSVNGTLGSESTSSAVSGSGTVVFGGVPSPAGDAWWKNSAWTGTVEIKGVSALNGDYVFNDYGNSGSTLKLTNCSGWLKPNYTCVPALEIGGVFTWNDGSSGLNNTFKVATLKGSGTISIPNQGASTAVWQITDDWSGFTGPVVGNNGAAKRIMVFGSTLPSTVTAGDIYISEGATLDLDNSSSAWWGVGMRFVVDGTVKASARNKWGGGTAMTLGDTGVLELTSTGNINDSTVGTSPTSADFSNVTGTGTIKYSSTAGWRAFPDQDAKMPAFTVGIQVELADSLIISKSDGETVIGSLSGLKNIRSDFNSNGAAGRILTVTQSKDTEWQGKFVSNRITKFNVVAPAEGTSGTLTLSGAQEATIPMQIDGAVNLTGTWIGATTVAGTFGGTGTLTGNLTFSDGATLKANASALTVSGTVTIPAGEGGALTIDATGLDADEVTILSSESIATETDVSKVTVDGLYTVEAVAGALKLVSTRVEVTVPAINNATVTVSVGGETIGTEAGTYKVAPDAVVTATYAAAEGYEISGQTVYTIDVSNGETTFDPAGTTEVKQYVASITTGELVVKYTSLQAAIDATAQTNSKIVLLANEEDGATIPAVDGKMFYFYAGEFTHGEIANAEGNFITTSTEEVISIGGVDVTATKYRVNAAVALVVLANEQAGTYYGDPMLAYNAFLAGPVGTTMQVFGNNPFSTEIPCTTYDSETQTYTKLEAVASITVGQVTSNYPSLAAAVAAAEAGQTVTMLADDHVSFAAVTVENGVPSGGSIVIDKNITINGAGFTVYGNTNAEILNATASATPGYDMVADLVDGSNLLGFFVKSGNVTFQNVTLTEFGNTAYVNKFGYTPIQTASAYTGTLTLTNVNFNKFNRTAVCVRGGTLAMTGGTIAGGTVNKNNGDYFQQPVEVRGGTATIDGVTITGGNDIVGGNGGGAIVAWGDTTVNNVNIDFTGIGVWADVANVAITGDDTEISATTQSVFVEEGGSATIAAGDFSGSLAVDSDANSSITVSGGTFDAAVPAEYCATGYEPKDNGDGTYTVRVDLGWIYEAADYPNYTGSWSNEVVYSEGKAHIEDGNTYTANRPSDGRMVTVAMTLSFDDVNDEDETVGDAKAAVKLATGGFKVYTSEGPDGAVTSVWKSVTIEGSDMIPVADQDYKFLFVLDLTNTTYTAALITSGGAATNALVLTDGSVANIPFASRGNVAPVQKIEFIGSGSVTSIEGSYEDGPAPVDVFVEDESITLSDGSVSLSADQAAWLNKLGAKSDVATRLGQLTSAQFSAAYLLNLDLMGDFTYAFKATDITVGDSYVEVEVTLTRTGTRVDGKASINGTLKLTGTDELGHTFEVKDTATITDAHFSAGDGEATISFPKDASTKFFQPVIE